MTELNIVEDKSLREQVAGRVDVLDKVKELFLLPRLEMMTAQQVADYYGVGVDAVQKCYRRNKDEINMDGASKIPVKSMVSRFGQDVQIVSYRGYKDIKLSDDITLRVPNVGILLFPKRAILRIGMLLRDSEVAKEVRTQLLNTFEHATPEERVEEIDRELERVKESNKMLTGEILRWDNRPAVNAAVRVIAWEYETKPQYIWMELYKELRNKHKIDLGIRRGKARNGAYRSQLSFVKDDEWPVVQQTLAALCVEMGLDPAEIFEKSKVMQNA
jgi:hypothetical protein